MYNINAIKSSCISYRVIIITSLTLSTYYKCNNASDWPVTSSATLWSSYWIPPSSLLQAEWTVNIVIFPWSLLYLTAQRKSHNNSDKVEVLTTPKGARNPLGPILLRLQAAPLMICLSSLWFQLNCRLWGWFNHTGIRKKHDNFWLWYCKESSEENNQRVLKNLIL